MTRACFAATIALGVIFIGIGLFVVPALPYVQLDRVLTPAELADDGVREETLELLENALGNQALLWTVWGLLQTGIGVVGLLAERRSYVWSDKSTSRRVDCQLFCEDN